MGGNQVMLNFTRMLIQCAKLCIVDILVTRCPQLQNVERMNNLNELSMTLVLDL